MQIRCTIFFVLAIGYLSFLGAMGRREEDYKWRESLRRYPELDNKSYRPLTLRKQVRNVEKQTGRLKRILLKLELFLQRVERLKLNKRKNRW